VGTGNDWGKLFGIPLDYEKAIRIIRDGHIMLQDAGMVYYYHGTSRQKRYFINIAGLGFDAVVVKRTNIQKDKGRKGKAIYLINLLKSLLLYSHTYTSVEIDGKKILGMYLPSASGSASIRRGMMQTPHAIPDDGLFDITIIKKIRKDEIIMSLKMLYDGSILDHPKIEGTRAGISGLTPTR